MKKQNRFRYNLMNLRAKGKPGGYTREEMADMLSCHPKTIERWEQGVQDPKLSWVIKIADTFGVTLDQLVYGERLR